MVPTSPLVFSYCELSHMIFHSKWQPRTILSENSCHFVNLLSFARSSFFLSMRKITWLNSQQPKTRGCVEHLGYYRINRKESNSDRCRSPEVFYLTSINRINRNYHIRNTRIFILKLICNIIVELLTNIQFTRLKMWKKTWVLMYVFRSRGKYNVENLKVSCDHHKNQKIRPKGPGQRSRTFYSPLLRCKICWLSTASRLIQWISWITKLFIGFSK